jgi:surfeit locus 1 family protein
MPRNYQILETHANEIYAFSHKNFMIGSMKKFQPPLSAMICALLAFTILIGLGTWQIKRLEWKTALLAEISARMEKPPVPLPEKLDNPASWEYRRATMTGHFIYNHEFLIKPRTLDGVSGYHMLVPFARLSGGTVMVNRGWISDELMTKAYRPQDTIQIEGIIQLPHKSYWTPPNAPQKNDWYWPDVGAMAAAAQLKNVAPVIFTISTAKPGVYPVAGEVELNIPNDHKQYAIFWFLMAFASQVIFFLRFRQA